MKDLVGRASKLPTMEPVRSTIAVRPKVSLAGVHAPSLIAVAHPMKSPVFHALARRKGR